VAVGPCAASCPFLASLHPTHSLIINHQSTSHPLLILISIFQKELGTMSSEEPKGKAPADDEDVSRNRFAVLV
jgi:hypothetical protein